MRWLAITLCLVASAAYAEQELPVYPGAVHTRIGNDLVIGGRYYRIAYFTTQDSPSKVGRYFADLWTKAGYPVTVDGDFQPEGVVSAFYTREGLQRSVVVTQHMGKTLAFTVLKDLWASPKEKPAKDLVQLEGTLFSQDLGARDAPNASQQRTSVVQRGLDEVRKSLLSELSAKGYRVVHETKTTEQGKLGYVEELQRGGEQIDASLVTVDPTMTAVLETWAGSPGARAKEAQR